MKIFNIGEIDNDYLETAGGKARGLDKLVREGFNVAPGFVLIGVIGDDDLENVASYFLKSGLGKVAVRSSATAEDGADFSYAGQFKTFLNIDNVENFKDAVSECIKSLSDGPGKSYSDKFGKTTNMGMSIVVQKMVNADYAGVCFTADPNNADNLLVEAVEGLGEALVSGTAMAARYSVPHKITLAVDKEGFAALNSENGLLTTEILQEVCIQAMQMQKIFNMPLDTEWAVENGILYWLQARPITVLETCEEDEFDPKEDLSGHITTRCNIGEMLPGAVTPLTWSISLHAIDWGLREMLRVAGAIKRVDDLPPYSCAFSSHGHLFMNLSTLYSLTNAAFLAKVDDINFSICGRKLDEVGIVPGRKPWFLRRAINTIKYLRFISSRNKARKRLAKIADTFAIYNGQRDATELFNAINDQKHIASRVAYLHYITSAHSGAMSSAVIQILNKNYKDLEKCKEILAELLQRIEGIESVDILASLRRIAQAITWVEPQAKQFDNRELAQFLENPGEEVQKEMAEFFRRHGHRCIREAELRSRGLADDGKAFTEFLKTVIAGGTEENAKEPPPDIKKLCREHGFRGVRGKVLVYLIKQARQGVKNREYSKSKLIRVLDEFKKAYNQLAVMLVKQGRLPDEDAIFFLTHLEIGTLVNGENASLVKRALQRRRLLKTQSELGFDEIYLGLPKPIEKSALVEAGGSLRGTSISRGSATGPARVVRSTQDAAQLQKGEIMVAVYTDIGWSPYYCLIDGLVTEIGSTLSHGAVVAREYALPFVSNVANATSLIRTGDIITVNGTTGNVALKNL